jgi:hypothetical protein
MKKLHFKLSTLLLTCLCLTSFKHPIKLTASLIDFESATGHLRMECRVFIDDFEYSINQTLAKDINISNPTKEDKKGIEEYFKKYYSVKLNEISYALKYSSIEVMKEYNVVTIKFEPQKIDIKKGDKLIIYNTLFFKEFAYMQTNRITIRMPPFFNEANFQTTIDDFTITKSL